MGAENIKVEAMKTIYGEDVEQVEKIICLADSVSHSLSSKYIKLYTPSGAQHVFWFKKTGDTAPSVPGSTLHEVDIVANDSAAAVATALQAVIDGVSGVFNATVSGAIVTFNQLVVGYASQAEDGVAGSETDFGLQIVTQGDSELDLGCVEGDIEVAFEETFVDVKCHDTGTTPVASLKTGVGNVEITLAMLETTLDKLKALFTKTNGSFTPNGAGATELFGMGTYKNFENMFKFASKLRLHPVRLLDGDKSEDWTFHKAIPKLKGMTFSGENVQKLPLTFQVFPAEGVNKRIDYFSVGDASQSLV